VFAVWNYQNMKAGMTVKREWFLNGQVWLTREEPWDFAKYGASGTLREISIFDHTVGLDSGAYQLRLYVDNVVQPIGNSINGQVENWANFEILPSKSILEAVSPDAQSDAAVLDGKTLVVRDARRIPSVITTGREIPRLVWMPDNQHILFVDRDRSGQQGQSTIGIRDELWLADIATLDAHLLYKSDTALAENYGIVISPDGHFVATTEGSGYGDACFVDTHLMFFELASDFSIVNTIKQKQFTGLPTVPNSSVFPHEAGAWQDNTHYLTKLSEACNEQSQLGMYAFDVTIKNATNVSAGTASPTSGDLGWGTIHGKVTNAVTGAPIIGALVSCSHNSYTSPHPCSGTVVTDANGMYVFAAIFFRDTDTIKLTVQALGYQTQEITKSAFTTPDMEENFSLSYFR
ncbi:MAG: carboxypeptidase-like regulatory domain-containing protein, partial [Chloroflexota bacterium]